VQQMKLREGHSFTRPINTERELYALKVEPLR
jgi:hypothetical protein